MGLALGLDGKKRALNINKTEDVSKIEALYIGLLQSAPANMEQMDLGILIHEDNGNEFPISSDFYTGRQAIPLRITTTDESGATTSNNNTEPITWTNNTGSTIEVAGLFITDSPSGNSGQVIWVGTPDAGTATINNGSDAIISEDDLILRVD